MSASFMPKQRQNMHINSNSNGQETMNFSMKNASLASIGGIKNPSNPDVETKIVSSDGTHYDIGSEIGHGAFGVVLQARKSETGEIVAVKRFPLTSIAKNQLASIKSEIDLMKMLVHDNIVKYIDTIEGENYLYIVLEYMEKGSLLDLLRVFGCCSEKLCACYTRDVLSGLIYLHEQGVLHRDIKAHNILANKSANVKLADFGVAVKLNVDGEEKIHDTVSPYWVAPEIIEMNPPTPACDIWSLGCLVIELLTGSPPYIHLNANAAMFRIVQDPMPLPSGVSSTVKDFLQLCFRKDPSLRPSAKELFSHKWIQDNLTEKAELKSNIVVRNRLNLGTSQLVSQNDSNSIYSSINSKVLSSYDFEETSNEKGNYNQSNNGNVNDVWTKKTNILSNQINFKDNESPTNSVELFFDKNQENEFSMSSSGEPSPKTVISSFFPTLSSMLKETDNSVKVDKSQQTDDYWINQFEYENSSSTQVSRDTDEVDVSKLERNSSSDDSVSKIVKLKIKSKSDSLINTTSNSLANATETVSKTDHVFSDSQSIKVILGGMLPITLVTDSKEFVFDDANEVNNSFPSPSLSEDRKYGSKSFDVVTSDNGDWSSVETVESASAAFNNSHSISTSSLASVSMDALVGRKFPTLSSSEFEKNHVHMRTNSNSMSLNDAEGSFEYDYSVSSLQNALSTSNAKNSYSRTIEKSHSADEADDDNSVYSKPNKLIHYQSVDDIIDSNSQQKLIKSPVSKPVLSISILEPTHSVMKYKDALALEDGNTVDTMRNVIEHIKLAIIATSDKFDMKKSRNDSDASLHCDCADIPDSTLDMLCEVLLNIMDSNKSRLLVNNFITVYGVTPIFDLLEIKDPSTGNITMVLESENVLKILNKFIEQNIHVQESLVLFGLIPLVMNILRIGCDQVRVKVSDSLSPFVTNSTVSTASNLVIPKVFNFEASETKKCVVNTVNVPHSHTSSNQASNLFLMKVTNNQDLKSNATSPTTNSCSNSPSSSVSQSSSKPKETMNQNFQSAQLTDLNGSNQNIDTVFPIIFDPITVEAARSIFLFCTTSEKTTSHFISSGGIRSLIDMIGVGSVMLYPRPLKYCISLLQPTDLSANPNVSPFNHHSINGLSLNSPLVYKPSKRSQYHPFRFIIQYANTTSTNLSIMTKSILSNTSDSAKSICCRGIDALMHIFLMKRPKSERRDLYRFFDKYGLLTPLAEAFYNFLFIYHNTYMLNESQNRCNSIPEIAVDINDDTNSNAHLSTQENSVTFGCDKKPDVVSSLLVVRRNTINAADSMVEYTYLMKIALIYYNLTSYNDSFSKNISQGGVGGIVWIILLFLQSPEFRTNCASVSSTPSSNHSTKNDGFFNLNSTSYGDSDATKNNISCYSSNSLNNTPLHSPGVSEPQSEAGSEGYKIKHDVNVSNSLHVVVNEDISSFADVSTSRSKLSTRSSNSFNSRFSPQSTNSDIPGIVVKLTPPYIELILILIKILRNLSRQATLIPTLDSAGTIGTLAHILDGPIMTASDDCQHRTIVSLYHMCRLNNKRLDQASMLGVIPHLKQIISGADKPTANKHSTEMKNLCISLMCSFAYAMLSRLELKKNNGVLFYLDILENEIWQTHAFNSLVIWITKDTDYVQNVLMLPENLNKLIRFIKLSSHASLNERVQKIMLISDELASAFSHSSDFVSSLIHKISISTEASMLSSLLRILQLVYLNQTNQNDFIMQYNLASLITKLSQNKTQILVCQIANGLLNDFKLAT